MQMKNKTLAIVITLILVTSMAISIEAIQPTSAVLINGYNYDQATADAINAGMHWTGMNANASATRLLLWNRFHDSIPTHVYIMAAPNPAGVGQAFNVVMFNPQVPPSASLGNAIRYQFKLNVVKPDGSTETLPAAGTSSGSVSTGGVINGAFVSDSTGSGYTAYTPDQVGNYTFAVTVLDFYYQWNSSTGGSSDYYGTTFKSSNFTLTVDVQQEQVGLIGLPLLQPVPTEYWTRPIEGQNTQWYTVSSNWLSDSHDRDNGGMENRFTPDGIAPNSAHILWTRPTEDNGIVGGTNDGRNGGNAFNAGSQYQPRNLNPIIMYGRLYFCPNVFYTGQGNFMDCVDLKTGELIYEVNTTALVGTKFAMTSYTTSTNPSNSWFGYYYSQDDPNQHGIVTPGWLFTPDYHFSLQPERGVPGPFNITNVPVATASVELNGPSGENLRYQLVNKGNTTNPSWYLSQWNSSKVIPASSDGTSIQNIDASTAARYDWNVSMPWSFSTTPTIKAAKLGDILWGFNGSWPSASGSPSYAYPDQVTIWAVSLDPSTLGKAIYMKNIQVDDAIANTNQLFERASADANVFVTNEVPICKFHVYDMHTGSELFSTDTQADLNAYGYFTWPSQIAVTQTKLAYGMLYTGGYVGAVSAYNLTTGELQWRHMFPSGGEKIQNYVQMLALIADNKIYVGTHEHSADTPLYKGEQIHCLNALTGEILWDLNAWGYPETFATADGVLIFWNNYDAQVYAVGKGPTQMTVTAPNTGAEFGTPVVIRGTVTDISAGTKQQEQAARFPNGVAAVSDASQQDWMAYVYMQKGRPTNTTGVPVTLSVVDSNGNYREIGSATSDSSGMFTYTWTPDIQGSYTVIASFTGSESYWPSYAESSFAVSNPTQSPAPTATPTQSAADLYLLPGIVSIIVAIVVCFAITILVLRKRP
jgi:outer membrane protein assembly factor BamB